MTEQPIAITGIGAISGHGTNINTIWEGVITGKNIIKPINPETHFDTEQYDKSCSGRLAAALSMTDKELGDLAGLEYKEIRKHDRHQLFALIAAAEAIQQAELNGLSEEDRLRVGVIGATGGDGGLNAAFETCKKLLNNQKIGPFDNIKYLANIHPGQIALRYGFGGPRLVDGTACASGAHAIMRGADFIKLKRANIMVVGGADAAIGPYGISTFGGQNALGSDSIPYTVGRDGFIMGEGAAFMVLESEESARKRGVKILGWITGYCANGDLPLGGSITEPNPKGGFRCASEALEMAGLSASDIDYVNTHGTSTPVGDAAECEGLRMLLGEYAPITALSSTKSTTGHLLGAAGAIEALFCVKALQTSIIPPTRDLSPIVDVKEGVEPPVNMLDAACAGFDHVMVEARHQNVDIALSNAFGFSGTNGTIITQAD